jgi:diadenosine tetraphosphatase ApaH/serine/threonine PP2A family protein phosphatase
MVGLAVTRAAVLDTSSGGLEVTIERVRYDAEAVAEQVREAGLPVEYADKLLTAA